MYTDRASRNARAILREMGLHEEPHPGLANFIWMRNRYRHLFRQLRTDQLMNHIPGEKAIYDKGHLTWHLHKFDQLQKSGQFTSCEFYPETYCLYRKEGREAFLKHVPKVDSPDNLWILKPVNLSRGIGVEVVWELKKVQKKLENPQAVVPDISADFSERYVIQRYIKNPLLLDGHKSEVRLYWLIACLDPLLVLLYEEGTVRRTALPFQLGEFDNPLIHITNAYQQKKHHPNAGDLVLKWRFEDLQTYLSHDLKLAGPDFIDQQLKAKWKTMFAYIVSAARKTLMRRPANGLFWALLGADVILDDALHPWLTEVQVCPGLSHDDAIKKKLIPPMLQEAAEIALEVQRRKRAGDSLADLDARMRFEWVINEAC